MIKVVDMQGRDKGVTYYKRAKGLVKNGRARYISDNCICMMYACPPYKSEDEMMNDVIYDNDGVVKEERADSNFPLIYEILKRIDYVIGDSEYLNNAVSAINAIKIIDVAYGSNNAAQKADAICKTVEAREATNQKVLDILRMIYEDAYGNKDTDKLL